MRKFPFLLLVVIVALSFFCCNGQKSSSEQTSEPVSSENPERGNAVGDMFVDFEVEYNGKVQKLSDYVGNGKYVIVDFWASWCRPCRGEIPNLIDIYNRYKSQGVDVVGVCTWDKPEDSKAAISELGIPYPQILNAQEVGSNAYNFDGIPQIILFAPDGTILARDLFGEEVEKCLKNAMKN